MKFERRPEGPTIVLIPPPSRHQYAAQLPAYSEIHLTPEEGEELCVSRHDDGSVRVWTRKKTRGAP